MTRLRPVLMTALLRVCFIPISQLGRSGSSTSACDGRDRRPYSSTLLTLLILPTLYAWFMDPKSLRRKLYETDHGDRAPFTIEKLVVAFEDIEDFLA